MEHARAFGTQRVAALALVLVLAVTGCSGRAGDPVPATPAGGAASHGPSAAAPATAPVSGPGIVRTLRAWLVVPDESGLPVARAGTVVQETRSDPVGAGGASDSVGLRLARGGSTRWVLAVLDRGHLHVDSERPRLSSWLTFDEWLTDTADVERGGPGLVLADLSGDGAVVPAARGVRVLDHAAVHDGLMDPFRETRTSTAAVAIVRWQRHRWFVFVERLRPRANRITVAASRIGFRAHTAEELLVRWDRAGRRP